MSWGMIKLRRMRYHFLENIATGDIAFEAWGKTLEELFAHAAEALMAVMAATKKIKPIFNFQFSIFNKNLDGLLFDFLSELVFLKDTEQLLFSKFKIKIKTPHPSRYTLIANLWGEKIDPKKHKLRSDVKAVTWHMF